MPPPKAPSSRPLVWPYLALALGVIAGSCGAIFARNAQAEAGSLAISAWRVSFAFAIVLPITLRRAGNELAHLTARQWLLAALAGLFLGLHFATWISSLRYTSVANSVVLVNTNPLWVGLLTPIFLRERLGRLTVLGIGLSVVGAVAMTNPTGSTDSPNALLGDGLALLGGLCAAVYLLVGRQLRQSISVLPYVCVCYGTASVALWCMAIAGDQVTFTYSAMTWANLLALALVSQILGHTSYNLVLQWFTAAFVAVALLAEPVLSAGLAYICFGETLSLLQWLGGGLILAGIYLASRAPR